MAVLHCRYCEADNTVEPDVIGKACDQCRKSIYSEAFEREIERSPKPLKATADRTGEVLRVTCPHCQFRNELPGFDMVFIFLCDEGGKPVEVAELAQ